MSSLELLAAHDAVGRDIRSRLNGDPGNLHARLSGTARSVKNSGRGLTIGIRFARPILYIGVPFREDLSTAFMEEAMRDVAAPGATGGG